eukprot:6474448-Prymnesium_polylepis.2
MSHSKGRARDVLAAKHEPFQGASDRMAALTISFRHQPSIVKPYSFRSRSSSFGGRSLSRTGRMSQLSRSQPSSSVGKYMHGEKRFTA